MSDLKPLMPEIEKKEDETNACSSAASLLEGQAWQKMGGVVSRSNIEKSEPTAKMTVSKDDSEYKMYHKYRGIAVILNHETFDMERIPVRKGTEKDVKALKTSLKKLGFRVHIYNDLTDTGIVAVLKKASKLDHSDNDCFLMAVLSHGEENLVYARNRKYDIDLLWEPFTADRCPTLAGKPKIFIMQVCRGNKLDEGITLLESSPYTQTYDNARTSYKIPVHADFVVAYSTIPGHFSIRNSEIGSFYIQHLCEQLDKQGDCLDLLSLLVVVSRRVATDVEMWAPSRSDAHGKKQMPCIVCMLTRTVRFNLKPTARCPDLLVEDVLDEV